MSTVVKPPRRKTTPHRELNISRPPEVVGESTAPVDVHHHHHEFESASLQQKIVVALAVIGPFLGLVLAIVLAWQFGWISPLFLGMLIGGWLLTGLGITVGFHRMLTHRSFDTYDWVRLAWAGVGSLAIEGPPLAWCAVHRKHHQHSDQEGDPHSPHLHDGGLLNTLKGFWHAHTGWLFNSNWDDATVNKYVPDLINIRGMKSISRNYLWWILASLLIPAVLGGLLTLSWNGVLLGFLWGGLARIFVTHHVTWSVNSICHIFGSRDYHSGDDSRNNVIFGILSHGEGWHNNHHAFPTSARHGLKWWQFDTSYLVIKVMGWLGLVWNIRTPSEKALEAKKVA
ncbi:MAG: acyl-CoA desaturase [Pirellulaceae bacterium]